MPGTRPWGQPEPDPGTRHGSVTDPSRIFVPGPIPKSLHHLCHCEPVQLHFCTTSALPLHHHSCTTLSAPPLLLHHLCICICTTSAPHLSHLCTCSPEHLQQPCCVPLHHLCTTSLVQHCICSAWTIHLASLHHLCTCIHTSSAVHLHQLPTCSPVHLHLCTTSGPAPAHSAST